MRTLISSATAVMVVGLAACKGRDKVGSSTEASAPAAADSTTTSMSAGMVGSDELPTQALNRMSSYMQSVKIAQLHAVTTKDQVLDDGQLVQSDGVVDMLIRRPDRLRVEVESPQQHRVYFYDGKTITVWAVRANYYASAPAPPTIGGLVDMLHDKYGIQLPLEDLFYWGTPKSGLHDVTSATDVGPSPIEGVTCEQYAMRQDGLDWQVWIQRGDFPLPRKVVYTTTSDESRPQFSSVITWNLAPSYNESAFQFIPPPGTHRIVLAAQDTTKAAKP